MKTAEEGRNYSNTVALSATRRSLEQLKDERSKMAVTAEERATSAEQPHARTMSQMRSHQRPAARPRLLIGEYLQQCHGRCLVTFISSCGALAVRHLANV